MTATESYDPAPDWDNLTTEMHCPLCEYNLRGLVQPRCPECGFAFTWTELIFGQQQTHPYLFEHQPKRNMWSFWKTYWRDCLPQSFWIELSPAQPVRVRRLIMYWALTTFVVFATMVLPFSYSVWDNFQFPPPNFALPSGLRWVPPPAPPPPTFMERFQDACQSAMAHLFEHSLFTAAVTTLLWPWLTLLVLMVFAESMRKARINKRHVLRVIIYGTDFAIAMLLPALVGYGARFSDGYPLMIAMVCSGITFYRVGIAYKQYLRFHMPFATVLSSQIIVMMIFLIVYIRVVQH